MRPKSKLQFYYKTFPIRVKIWRRRNNSWDIEDDFARIERKWERNEDGEVAVNYMLLKKDKEMLPAPDRSFMRKDGKGEKLYLANIGDGIYYPIYEEAGKYKVTLKVPKEDENGEPLKNKAGEIIYDEVEQVIQDMSILLDNCELVKMPSMKTIKTYDKDQWAMQQIERSNRHFKTGSDWTRFIPLISAGIVSVFLILALILSYKGITDMTEDLTVAMRDVAGKMVDVSSNLKDTGAVDKVTGSGNNQAPF